MFTASIWPARSLSGAAVIMSDQGTWISLQRAVVTVHAVMGGAPGPVYQTLISICADGLARARWTGHHSRTRPAIHKRDWVGADIDWSTPGGRVVKADGAGMAGVDFSEDDLNAWVAQQSPRSKGGQSKGGRKRLIEQQAITAEISRLMDHHGPFSADDAEWNAQARLEEKITAFAAERLGEEPGENTVRTWVQEGLASYRMARTET
jgi:hypothetical protein